MNALALAIALLALAGASSAEEPAQPAEGPAFTTGNGKANWIVTEGATRRGATFSFREVRIDGNGWLVMHPFKDGKPVGDVYVGSTYLKDGDNRDVEITVDSVPKPGDMFIVMLHRDVNEDGLFDFVFVDEHNVLDRAVFEGAVELGDCLLRQGARADAVAGANTAAPTSVREHSLVVVAELFDQLEASENQLINVLVRVCVVEHVVKDRRITVSTLLLSL